MKKYSFIAAVFMAISLIAGLPSYGAELKEVQVSNTKELIAAIGDNTRIILAPGVYNITDWQTGGSSEYGAVQIFERRNLQLIGQNPAKETKLTVDSDDKPVLSIENSKDILLKGLSLGHKGAPGSCSDCVLQLDHCANVHLEELDLYGCGNRGIRALCGSGLQVVKCSIHDCSEGAIDISTAVDADPDFEYKSKIALEIADDPKPVFKDCEFVNCGNSVILAAEGEFTLSFINCKFSGNLGRLIYGDGDWPCSFHFDGCVVEP